MLVDSVKASDIALSLKTRAEYHPFLRTCEREQWDKLPNEAKWFYKNAANALKNCDWPELKAVRYMDFVRNGDRSRYEHSYFLRRDMLYSLMMGECLTGSGDYLDDIANGVWTICEETSWVIPAHNNHLTGDAPNALPDFEAQPYIDLFAAETASLLGWVYYMLGDELDGVTPLIKRRIEFELDKGTALPCSVRIDLDVSTYTRLYLYNTVSNKWQYLNSYTDGIITADTAGRYLLTNQNLKFANINWTFFIAGGVVVVLIGIAYVVLKKRYWFW